MVGNKHQEDLTHGKEGNNGLEVMISSFGFMTVFQLRKVSVNKTKPRYGTLRTSLKWNQELSLFQPKVSLIKLAFSFRAIVLVL